MAIATWLYPIKVAAQQETKEDTISINYAQFHKEPIQSANTSGKRTVPKPQEAYTGKRYSKEEVVQLIIDYSAEYRIKSDTPLCIAEKESGFQQFSANRTSTARGIFQYLAGTWASTDEGKAGLGVFDADANVRAAIKYMAIHRSTQPWVTRSSCPTLSLL